MVGHWKVSMMLVWVRRGGIEPFRWSKVVRMRALARPVLG